MDRVDLLRLSNRKTSCSLFKHTAGDNPHFSYFYFESSSSGRLLTPTFLFASLAPLVTDEGEQRANQVSAVAPPLLNTHRDTDTHSCPGPSAAAALTAAIICVCVLSCKVWTVICLKEPNSSYIIQSGNGRKRVQLNEDELVLIHFKCDEGRSQRDNTEQLRQALIQEVVRRVGPSHAASTPPPDLSDSCVGSKVRFDEHWLRQHHL